MRAYRKRADRCVSRVPPSTVEGNDTPDPGPRGEASKGKRTRRAGLGRWRGRLKNVPRPVVGGLLLAGGLAVLCVAVLPLVLDDNEEFVGDDLGPAPTYTGTDFIPESQARNTADAMSAFTTYIRVSDEVAQDGFRDWEDSLVPLTRGDVRKRLEDYGPRAERAGYSQVGERVVESVRLKQNGYVENRAMGLGTVYLGACIDSSGLQVVAPGSQGDGIPPGRYSVSVIMVYSPEEDDWGQMVPGKPGRWLVLDYFVDGSDDYGDQRWSPIGQDSASSCVERKESG